MITDNIEQRSLEWYRQRCGCVTGSRVADIMKTGRKKNERFSDTAKSYLYQIAGERLFNPIFLNDDDIFQDYIEQTSFTSKAIQWGIDMEDQAKQCFESLNEDVKIEEVSSCRHKTIDYFAASPDGIIYGQDKDDIQIVEIKCPNINTYMKYRTHICDNKSLKDTEEKYYWQMMAEMCCTGAKSGIFITYNPWLLKPIHWAIIKRDEEDIRLLEDRVILANEFIKNILDN